MSVADRLYPTLDLHGCTADEARERSHRWVAEQWERGERVIRLITGWGRHSVGPPVVRSEVRLLLTDLRGTMVRDFDLETGGGVFRVALRSPPRPPAAPPRARMAVTPAPPTGEEARRAIESLEELGVTPTPELIAAEVRRLRREADAR